MKIKCRFNNEGCKWCGFFGDFEKHLENCLIFNNKDIAISIIKNNILNNNKSKKENLSIFINENFGIINKYNIKDVNYYLYKWFLSWT